MDLKQVLEKHTVDMLRTLINLVADRNIPKRKADLVEFLSRQLAGERLKKLWERLDRLQQAAVAESVHGADSSFHALHFQAKYGELPNWGETDMFRSYIRTPSLLGLFFYNEIMPEDLRQRMKKLAPEPVPITLDTQDDIPEEWELSIREYSVKGTNRRTQLVPIKHCATDRAACHDLNAVLHLINTGKLAVSAKTHQPGVAAIKSVGGLLLGGEFYGKEEHDEDQKIGPIKAFAWPLLVQAGGLAKVSGTGLELSRAGIRALSVPAEKTIKNLWKRWLKTRLLDELNRIDCFKGQKGKGKRGLTAVTGRRAVIDEALRECPPGEWIAIDDLFNNMLAGGLDFEVTRDPWRLYIEDPNYGSLGYDGFHDWHILQARYALCLLFEYAATLGLIDVAYIPPHHARTDYRDIWGTDDYLFLSRYDGLLYFRINPLGAYCLEMAPNYVPATPRSEAVLRVLPNLEIVVLGESPLPADRLLLDSYLERVSDAVWRLDQGRLLQAIESGQALSVLRELLDSRSVDPLPETVNHFFEDITRRTQSLRDEGTAQLIECVDAALAAMIANDTRTKRYCLLAGDRHLVVPAKSETRFRTALRKLGYSLPK